MDPETRGNPDQAMAAIADEVGETLHAYPRAGRAVRRVVLRDDHDDRGTRFEAAQTDDDGSVRVVGHDAGPGVSDVVGEPVPGLRGPFTAG